MAQVFPQIHDQYQFNNVVKTLKDSIQDFNFHADIYNLHTKSILPGDLVNSEPLRIKHNINDSLHSALKNLDIANELIKDKLISNEYGLYSDCTIDRWIDIRNQNIEVLNLLLDQQRIHVDKENELRELRRHLVNFVPLDQQQRVGSSILNERNFAYWDFKNTQKTRKLFKYIVTRLKSVNKVVNQITINWENYR